MKKYRSRILDALLSKRLQAKGAVLIEGPKWCGKTTTAEQIARGKIMLARSDVKESFKRLLEIDLFRVVLCLLFLFFSLFQQMLTYEMEIAFFKTFDRRVLWEGLWMVG